MLTVIIIDYICDVIDYIYDVIIYNCSVYVLNSTDWAGESCNKTSKAKTKGIESQRQRRLNFLAH